VTNRWIIVADEVHQVLNIGAFSSIVGPDNKGDPNILLQAHGIHNISLFLKPKVPFLKLLA
jgi:hypothetical protein